MTTLVLKKCSRCKEWKPRQEFYKNNSKQDGLQTECSDCHIKYSADYKQAHREYYTDLERERYHRIQDEAGCHRDIREFYPGYRFINALAEAGVIEIDTKSEVKRNQIESHIEGDDLLDD